MTIYATLKISLRALRANRVRTILAVLGVVIGIAAVIIVYSAGEGIRRLVVGQVESFGTDIIESEMRIPKKGSKEKADQGGTQSGISMAQGVVITTMTLEDMEDINKLPNVKNSYAGILGQEQASYGSEVKKAFLYGVSSSYVDIDKSKVEFGRFYSDAEEKSLSQVVVLGTNIKEQLFGNTDPIGKLIKIRKSKYRVIGIMEKRGSAGGLNFDDYVYIPLQTLQKRVQGINHVLFMIHQLRDVSKDDDTAEEIRTILRENHGITDPEKDDFAVITMKEMLKILDTVTGALTLLLLAIVAISLVVGGVGVMNIMYVTVTERTREIGLRKAVGANNRAILSQFLVESIIITMLGGVFGILIGIGASFAIAKIAAQYGMEWEFAVPLKSFAVALGYSGIFGIFFGVYPARRASRLDPITALRNE
jgi:putative ABC transport system permease protein